MLFRQKTRINPSTEGEVQEVIGEARLEVWNRFFAREFDVLVHSC